MSKLNTSQAFGQAASNLAFQTAREQSHSLEIQGELPDWARATLYLNGPACFQHGDLKRGHWIDGDGLLRRLRFGDGRAHFSARYARSQRRVDELAAGQALYRAFGTSFKGDRLRRGLALYSPANVSLHPYGGKLLAFGEQSLPFQLEWDNEAARLDTVGEFNFNDTLPELTPLSAHPKFDPVNGHMVNFGALYTGQNTRFHYYEWDTSFTLCQQGEIELDTNPLVHDCLITPAYACFHIGPYALDIFAFLREGISLLDAMRWHQEQASELLVFSRHGGEVLARVPAGGKGFCLHTLNAHEADGMLMLDILEAEVPYYDQYYADPGLFSGIGPSSVRRNVFDTSDWSLREVQQHRPDLHLDFPCLARRDVGQPYRHAWMLGMPCGDPPGAKFYDRLLRFDWRSGEFADQHRTGDGVFLAAEQQFIPQPGKSDAGILVCQEFNARDAGSAYVFFDAFDLRRGPVARVSLPEFDPPAFHTSLSME